MLSFGLKLGSSSGKSCDTLPEGEVFYNRHFECGLEYWSTNAYGGDLEVVDNTSIRLTATDVHSSLTQHNQFPIPAGSYHIGVVVTECSGNGKFAYQLADHTWVTPITFTSAGTFEIDITADQEIIAMDIGSDNDASFSAVFDGISCMDASVVHYPDWWQIDTLDQADILGAWDFNWIGVDNTETAKTNLHGTMPSFDTIMGGPSWRENQGIYFGGGGAFGSPLPDGIDMNNLTTIIQVADVRQNATLDAFYSHYKSSSHYTLQNGWGSNAIRWSCGNGDSTTIEVGSPVTNGVIATAGRDLYVDGSLLGTVPESGEGLSSSDQFVLGAIILDDGRIVQNIIGVVVKVLVVQRQLTEAEVQEITANMTGGSQAIVDMDNDGKADIIIAQHGDVTVTEDEDSINVDVDGDMIADMVVPK